MYHFKKNIEILILSSETSILIYLTSIASKIAKWFTFPSNIKDVIQKTATIVINAFDDRIIINFLEENLDKNIEQL